MVRIAETMALLYTYNFRCLNEIGTSYSLKQQQQQQKLGEFGLSFASASGCYFNGCN